MDLDFLDTLLQSAANEQDEWDLTAIAIDAVLNMSATPSSCPPPAPHFDPSAPLPTSFVTPLPPPAPHEEMDIDLDDVDDVDDEVEAEPSTSTADAAAIKRMRHRQVMQRCRERKRYRMDHLETKQRKKKHELRQQLYEFRLREERRASDEPVANKVEELRKLFAHAVHMKEALLDERQALEVSLRDHQKFERVVLQSTKHIVNDPMAKLAPMLAGHANEHGRRIQDDSMEEEDASSSSNTDPGDAIGTPGEPPRPRKHGPTGHWVQYLDDEPPLFYEPESTESIEEHIRECYIRVRRLQSAFEANVLGARDTYCLGWKAQHSITRTVDQKLELRFRFRRRVPLSRLTLDELQQASWKVMRDPVQNARLYSALVVCKIVQFLGENTFIFLRNSPDKDKRLHVRYFSMHSQMEHRTSENERAFLTLMKIIDKDPHVLEPEDGAKPATPVIWLKQGTLFMHLTEKLDDQQIEIEYGGAVHCLSEDHARYLMVEVSGQLMRWEQFVVPQRLLPF